MREQAETPDIAQQFRAFAVGAARDGAPLYERICNGVAGDSGLLGLLAEAPPDQRRPNLLLAAVHYLLLAGAGGPLGGHYRTVAVWRASELGGDVMHGGGLPQLRSAPRSADAAGTPRPDPFSDFKAFCELHRDQLAGLIATRATQTNEVGRCIALLPTFAGLAARYELPLSLLDLGSSAGLNLLFDRYAYAYTRAPAGASTDSSAEVVRAGRAGSPVLLDAELREGVLPDLEVPRVAHRAGIDRHPVDPVNEDQSLWLLACQWPDHVERFRRLRDALALARTIPERARVTTGDVVSSLQGAAQAAPAGAHLCIFHTWVAAYLTPRRQEELVAAVSGLAQERPVSWIFAENPYEVPALPLPAPPGGRTVKGSTALVLVEFTGGRARSRRLADMHPHGRWIHWWGWPD